MKIAVITLSDRAAAGIYDDRSGPEIEKLLLLSDPDLKIKRLLIPDNSEALIGAFKECPDCGWVLTCGGTGISPRDITPETTESYCDKLLPGIADLLRRESLKETPFAVFSRGSAGIKGETIIVNLPGSVKGAVFCTRLLVPLLKHGTAMLMGGGHEHAV